MNTQGPYWRGGEVFDSAEVALQWAVEVLRRRRLPKLSRIWVEASGSRLNEHDLRQRERALYDECEQVAAVWEGPKNVRIPQDADERLSLALCVMAAVDALAPAQPELRPILLLWAMGDWADEARLRGALAMQEKLRRDGVRVRISYRYSYEQLGRVLGLTAKSAWRRVQWALEALGPLLAERGVLAPLEPQAEPQGAPRALPGGGGLGVEVAQMKKRVDARCFYGDVVKSS